jgi:hypothetical protein
LKQFEEGIKLARRCEKALGQAEKRIEVLMERAEGELETQAFGEASEGDETPAAPSSQEEEPSGRATPKRRRSRKNDEAEDEEGDLLF